jgi:nucleoside-diphosphate kinase
MKIVGMKLIKVTDELAERHYEEHLQKDFYPRLKKYIMSGPVVVAVIEAPDAVAQVRKMVGATDPANADVGTIRHTWAQHISSNIIHASDNPESAQREISIYFKDNELYDYGLNIHKWLFSD